MNPRIIPEQTPVGGPGLIGPGVVVVGTRINFVRNLFQLWEVSTFYPTLEV